ncbi:hypothetical protein [Sphingobacterium psychroaquaticum]|uniref:Uncharacterized protein n=1 Tax=Sphingobacterium psychroaquaticum TaxID=561061 RepID=A0A1X7IZE5_9SPHI|nr:hypothetical protein [Sphingobacterium psychroaquaticum]SMG19830.1 hypothetical protein SAMN05660862_1173 [Sphingobacterium psychroaquaticum]
MTKSYSLSILLYFLTLGVASAQVKIDDNISTIERIPNSNALLDLSSVRRGLLFPRLSLTSTTNPAPLSQHERGMVVYNLANQGDITPGIYYNNGINWLKVPERNGNDITYNEETNILRFITEDNEAVSVDLKAINAFTTSNGVKKNKNDIQLGGPLTGPTSITTSASNTFALEGLIKDYHATQESIVVMNESNVLKKASAVAPLFFYCPSVVLPLSGNLNGNGQLEVNLYEIYKSQFGSPLVSSNPSESLPSYLAQELAYFITYYDTSLFENVSITPSGILAYTIKTGASVTEDSYMNIVFKVIK